MKEYLHEKLSKEGRETFLKPTQAEIDSVLSKLGKLSLKPKRENDEKKITPKVSKAKDWRVSIIIRTQEKIKRVESGDKKVYFGKLEKIAKEYLTGKISFDDLLYFFKGVASKHKLQQIIWKSSNTFRLKNYATKYRSNPKNITRITMATYLRLYNNLVVMFVDVTKKLKDESGKTGCKYHFNCRYVSYEDIERIYNILKKYNKDGFVETDKIKIGVKGEKL